MKNYPFGLLTLIILVNTSVFSQRLKKADRTIVTNIQNHVKYLNSENLEGRKGGSNGEKMAVEYISRQFARWGLKPKGDTSWYQHFEIYDGKDVMSSSQLSINGNQLKLYKDYFPLPFSANQNAEAAVAIALAENGVPWFKDLKEIVDGHDDSARMDTLEILKAKVTQAAQNGATALIIYNSSEKGDLDYNKYDRSPEAAIPVLFIKKDAFKKYCSDDSDILDVKLNVSLTDKKRTGNNVIGFADNGADSTIIAGAHLDEETEVAALIEVARLLRNVHKKKNFLFIAYSGEQKGRLGIDHFKQHPQSTFTL